MLIVRLFHPFRKTIKTNYSYNFEDYGYNSENYSYNLFCLLSSCPVVSILLVGNRITFSLKFELFLIG